MAPFYRKGLTASKGYRATSRDNILFTIKEYIPKNMTKE